MSAYKILFVDRRIPFMKNIWQYQNNFYIENQSIPLVRCKGIAFPHGFSTRLGGVSTDKGYETLDLGAGEDTVLTEENRRRFSESLGISRKSLIFAKQIHSVKTEYVTADDIGKDFECDAFITDKPELLIAVKTADCVPILFCDRKQGVIGAVHAGWRGTVAGIASICVKAMTDHGASIQNITAAIGPCIKSDCYEVDRAFAEAAAQSNCAALCLPHIVPDCSGEKYHADLSAMNRDILLSAGILRENIYISNFCTSCSNDLFFSHRAGKGKRGLMMAGIFIPNQIR